MVDAPSLDFTKDVEALIPGDRAAIVSLADILKAGVSRYQQGAEKLGAVSSTDWTGPAADQFRARFAPMPQEWSNASQSHAGAHNAVSTYLTAFDTARTSAAHAVELWRQGNVVTESAMVEFRAGRQDQRGHGALEPFHDPGNRLRIQAAKELGDARRLLKQAGDDAGDALAQHAVLAPESLSARVAAPAPTNPGVLLDLLGSMSAGEASAYLAKHPELTDLLAKEDPDAALAWWNALNTAEQEALTSAIPSVIGSLSGIPAMTRVAANRKNAATELDTIRDKMIALQAVRLAGRVTGKTTGDIDEKIAILNRERDYLRQVIDGTRNLYLYDPAKSRIIEMIGTISPETKHTITYVPGTFTNMNNFYDGDVQQIATRLIVEQPETVAFVYKDGAFPGEDDTSNDPNFSRIGEANDQNRALAAGKTLAAFESGLRSDPILAGTEFTAIGHSWGLANITASEIAGARFGKVISLSGAGMPAGWKANPSTGYTDYSYFDILQVAQITGQSAQRISPVSPLAAAISMAAVWDGDTPRSDPAFDRGPYYDGTDFLSLVGNHNLVAADSPENRDVLRDLKKEIYR